VETSGTGAIWHNYSQYDGFREGRLDKRQIDQWSSPCRGEIASVSLPMIRRDNARLCSTTIRIRRKTGIAKNMSARM
jgi:hypothetical protein